MNRFPRRLPQNPRNQKGYTVQDFIFYAVIAALAFLVAIGAYNRGMAMYRTASTATDVVEIKSAVDDLRGSRTDLTGMNIAQLCGAGNGNQGASFCGTNNDGKGANRYGGDYTLKVSSNVSQVDIGITSVDSDYVNAQANRLAPVSAGRCETLSGCTTVTATGTTVTVTM